MTQPSTDENTGMHGWEGLAGACATAALTLPPQQVRYLAERAAAVTSPAQVSTLPDRPPTVNFRTAALDIVHAWQSCSPTPTGPAIAGMLLTAATAADRARSQETVDLVWTGPGSREIHAQPTDEVIVSLINEAQRTVVLSTFASRRVPSVREALLKAQARGVGITLILENEQSSNGQYVPPKKDPFDGVSAEVLEWPKAQRPVRGQWTAALHAKFILVDTAALFITSANLTGFALDINIEAGVVIRGGPLPDRLFTHLRDLTYDHVLTPVE